MIEYARHVHDAENFRYVADWERTNGVDAIADSGEYSSSGPRW